MLLLGYLFEINASVTEEAFLAKKILYIGSTLIAPFLLIFTAFYCEIRIKKRIMASLLGISLCILALVWTTDSHKLVYASYWLDSSSYVTYLNKTSGPLHYINHIYAFVLFIVTADMMISEYSKRDSALRRKLILIVMGVLCSIVSNILYLINPFNLNINYGPFAATISCVFFCINILRYDMFDIVHRASAFALDSMKEAFILIDANCAFLSANPYSENIFPSITTLPKYAPIHSARNWPEELLQLRENADGVPIHFTTDDDKHYSAIVSPIYAGNESLTGYVIIIRDVTESILLERAEKERINAELSVATRIQMSMLPCKFPAFPERNEFDLYALMKPAREVGGDFYDFYLVDDNTLAVLIADVAGKGIPAALFMANAKAMIKSNTSSGASPKDILETVNNLLCEGNDEDMFVTVFMGMLDIPTRRFSYVNAGHCPPLIKHGDNFSLLAATPGALLAFMEDTHYSQEEIALQKGDILFFYTDGITEAIDINYNIFEESRLLETVNKCEYDSLSGLLMCVLEAIESFADGAEQADDITMLTLEMR